MCIRDSSLSVSVFQYGRVEKWVETERLVDKESAPRVTSCVVVDASKAGVSTDCVVGVANCEPEAPGSLKQETHLCVRVC